MKRSKRQQDKEPPAEKASPHRSRWRMRYAVYALLVVAAIVVRLAWRKEPTIPRPDVGDADIRFLIALDEKENEVRQSPREPKVWADLGVLLLAHTYASEAERCFQQAADLDPTDWHFPYLAAVAEKTDRPERAVASLQAATIRDPKAELPQLLRGELLIQLGRIDEAESHFL